MNKNSSVIELLEKIKGCTICAAHLPYPPNPVCSFSDKSRILLVGQAPGMKVHNSGVPWDDASGERLRGWLGVTSKQFYDTSLFAIVPMGFCYPGKGESGDLPPRPECSKEWMKKILMQLSERKLTILIGQYAQNYFLAEKKEKNLTLTVKNWEAYQPDYLVLPHPSPRNNIWLKKNPWFQEEVLPYLKKRVKALL